MTHAARLALLGALALGCQPTMIEREGHRVFNPRYRALLEFPSRDAWQRPDDVVRALAPLAGATVADVGAGTGYFTERFARAVGPEGRVLATDVQDEMVRALEERAAKRRLGNVTVVRAAFDDPSLAPGCCDLAFLANVYKEIDGRVAWLRRLEPALRAGGRVAIVDFRPGAPGYGPPEDVRLQEEIVIAELAAAGFALAARHDFLPRQYFLVFAREGCGRAAARRPDPACDGEKPAE
jgi:predicted methyltransferase